MVRNYPWHVTTHGQRAMITFHGKSYQLKYFELLMPHAFSQAHPTLQHCLHLCR